MDANEEKICNRIIGCAPTSVVISKQSDASLFVSTFIDSFTETLNEKKIIPIRIPVKSFKTALGFWKGMSNMIYNKLIGVFEEDDINYIDELITEIDKFAETGAIMSNLNSILDTAAEGGWRILAVLEDFDEIGNYMSEDDVNKLREMTSHLTELVISNQELNALAKSWYGNIYVVNQFKDPFYI